MVPWMTGEKTPGTMLAPHNGNKLPAFAQEFRQQIFQFSMVLNIAHKFLIPKQ